MRVGAECRGRLVNLENHLPLYISSSWSFIYDTFSDEFSLLPSLRNSLIIIETNTLYFTNLEFKRVHRQTPEAERLILARTLISQCAWRHPIPLLFPRPSHPQTLAWASFTNSCMQTEFCHILRWNEPQKSRGQLSAWADAAALHTTTIARLCPPERCCNISRSTAF